MKCVYCGTENINNSLYCVKCGNSLRTDVPINKELEKSVKLKMDTKEYIKKLPKEFIDLFLKPFHTFYLNTVAHKRRYNYIFALVVILLISFIDFIGCIIDRMFSFDVLLNDLIFYSLFIFGGSFIYYGAAKIINKKLSYSKVVKIISVSLLPYLFGCVFVPILLYEISFPITLLLMVSSFVYSFVILYELINNELKLDKDKKIWFNTLCFITIVVMFYLLVILVLDSMFGTTFIF